MNGRAAGALAAVLLLVPALAGLTPVRAQAPDAENAPRRRLIAYLDALAGAQLDERARAVAAIRTREDAERRKTELREIVLDLIGGLPEGRGPLAAQTLGTLDGSGFRIEKLVYESLPGFRVTANLYLPAGEGGPYPAVVLTPGHDPNGKAGLYAFGANLARAGIAALAYDPIGEGERIQHFDPDLGASRVGRPTGEHSHAGVQTLLVGEHVARYFVWDAMRGIDYLAGRADIDAGRIGAFGCSGGGTVTAYLAALDDRVKAAATACYLTTFRALLATAGPQEGEQSIPHFLARGLDLGDWVQMAAPRPYAIVSTEEDFFPFEGARAVYEEARRIYALYGAEDRLRWITAPGGHGALGPVSAELVAFFTRWLKDESATPGFTPMRPDQTEELWVTPTGQLSTSIGSETVHSLNRKEAPRRPDPARGVHTIADLEALRTRLQEDVRAVTGVTARPGAQPPEIRVLGGTRRNGYRLDTLALRGADGFTVPALLAVPDGAHPKPALVMMDARPKERLAAPGGEVDRLARAGRIVLVLQPRGTPGGTEEMKSPLLGTSYLLSLRALLVGRTILGLRTDDAIRAVDGLRARPDVQAGAVSVYGAGSLGPVALHAAALDARIDTLYLARALTAYRPAVDQPLHRDLPEVALPGVLRKYDLGDLLLAAPARRIVVIEPVRADGVPIDEQAFRGEMEDVLAADRRLGRAGRIRFIPRAPGDSLPVE